MGLGGPITPKIPVSSALRADCGFVNIYNPGNLSRVMTCFHQGMNLVSLLLGKLCVASHVYSSCLAVRDRLVMLLQLAFLASGGVALPRAGKDSCPDFKKINQRMLYRVIDVSGLANFVGD